MEIDCDCDCSQDSVDRPVARGAGRAVERHEVHEAEEKSCSEAETGKSVPVVGSE